MVSQCEKYNDVIWLAVKLALKTKNMLFSHWESVIYVLYVFTVRYNKCSPA